MCAVRLQGQQQLIDLAFAVRGALRRGLGGGRGGQPFLPHQGQGAGGGLLGGGGRFGPRLGRARHDQDVFPAGFGLGVMGGGLGEGGLPDLLVELGQLPAEGDAAVPAKGGGQLVEGGPQPVGRFVKDDGPHLPLQGGQPFAAQPALGGQKALKDPAGGILPRDGQGGDAGRRPRHRGDRDAAGQRVPDDDRAGVGDAGHPGVGAEGAALPRLDPAEDALAPAEGVLVVADHRLFQTQMVEQPHGDPGVLGGDKIRRPKDRGGPGGHVLQVADGGGDDIERSGHKVPPVKIKPENPARTARPPR